MVLLGASLGALPTAFAAQAATVLPIKMVGSTDPVAQAVLQGAVSQSLREQKILDVSAAERDAILLSEPKLAGCLTELCMERIGRLLDSQLVLRAQATLSGTSREPAPSTKGHGAAAADTADGDWEVRIDVFDVEVGAIGASLSSSCRACSAKQAAQAMSELVGRAVLESASRPRGYLAVTSVPSNAIVFVDGTELGYTPYKRITFVGSHKIVVRSTGYRSYQGEVQIDESKKQSVSVTLEPGADPVQVVVVEKSTPIYKKWWFWTVIAGAAVAAGGITAGIVLGTKEVVPNGTPSAFNIRF